MSVIKDKGRARRTARVVAGDMSLYHEEKVLKGVREDDLFERLATEIAEGREHYESKVSAEIARDENYFELALVDVLVLNKGHVKSEIW